VSSRKIGFLTIWTSVGFLTIVPEAQASGCACTVEIMPWSGGGSGAGKGAGSLRASSSASDQGLVSLAITKTSESGFGCDQFRVTYLDTTIWRPMDDSGHPAPPLRVFPSETFSNAANNIMIVDSQPVGVTTSHSFPIRELNARPDVQGLRHIEFSVQGMYDSAVVSGSCNTILPGQTGEDYKVEEDICVYPTDEVSVFRNWGSVDPTVGPFARFQARLKPNGGINKAKFAVASSFPDHQAYLHEVREVSAGATDECFELMEYYGLRNGCEEVTGLTGSSWLLQPADTAPVRNQWGEPIAGTKYTEYDSIGFPDTDCYNAYATMLKDKHNGGSCKIVLRQQMEFNCRTGGSLSAGSQASYQRPGGDWWKQYVYDQPIEITIKADGDVKISRDGVDSTIVNYPPY